MATIINKTSCTGCGYFVHGSNKKSSCTLCNSLVHQNCLCSAGVHYFCRLCIASELPFVNLIDDDFFGVIGFSNQKLKTLITNKCTQRLNLNPLNDLADGFVDNDGIDADINYYNLFSNQINDYCDSDQLDRLLSPCKSKNLVHFYMSTLEVWWQMLRSCV